MSYAMRFPPAVKEEIFVCEKCRTFPSKIFRLEFNFVLSERPKNERREETIEMPASQVEENLVWKLVSYFLQLYESYNNNNNNNNNNNYESYEIKFLTKNSSSTVYVDPSFV